MRCPKPARTSTPFFAACGKRNASGGALFVSSASHSHLCFRTLHTKLQESNPAAFAAAMDAARDRMRKREEVGNRTWLFSAMGSMKFLISDFYRRRRKKSSAYMVEIAQSPFKARKHSRRITLTRVNLLHNRGRRHRREKKTPTPPRQQMQLRVLPLLLPPSQGRRHRRKKEKRPPMKLLPRWRRQLSLLPRRLNCRKQKHLRKQSA